MKARNRRYRRRETNEEKQMYSPNIENYNIEKKSLRFTNLKLTMSIYFREI